MLVAPLDPYNPTQETGLLSPLSIISHIFKFHVSVLEFLICFFIPTLRLYKYSNNLEGRSHYHHLCLLMGTMYLSTYTSLVQRIVSLVMQALPSCPDDHFFLNTGLCLWSTACHLPTRFPSEA